jgi:hypothetical protein
VQNRRKSRKIAQRGSPEQVAFTNKSEAVSFPAGGSMNRTKQFALSAGLLCASTSPAMGRQPTKSERNLVSPGRGRMRRMTGATGRHFFLGAQYRY